MSCKKYVNYLLHFTLMLFFLLTVSGCSLLPWQGDKVIDISIENNSRTNYGKPYSVVIEQSANYDSFVADDYQTISQKALHDNVNVYVFDPKKQSAQQLKIQANGNPIAIYFIFNSTPIAQWKFFYKDPTKKKIHFNLTGGNIKQEA